MDRWVGYILSRYVRLDIRRESHSMEEKGSRKVETSARSRLCRVQSLPLIEVLSQTRGLR